MATAPRDHARAPLAAAGVSPGSEVTSGRRKVPRLWAVWLYNAGRDKRGARLSQRAPYVSLPEVLSLPLLLLLWSNHAVKH